MTAKGKGKGKARGRALPRTLSLDSRDGTAVFAGGREATRMR